MYFDYSKKMTASNEIKFGTTNDEVSRNRILRNAINYYVSNIDRLKKSGGNMTTHVYNYVCSLFALDEAKQRQTVRRKKHFTISPN